MARFQSEQNGWKSFVNSVSRSYAIGLHLFCMKRRCVSFLWWTIITTISGGLHTRALAITRKKRYDREKSIKWKTTRWYHMCAGTYYGEKWMPSAMKRNEKSFRKLTFLLTFLNESNCKRAKYNCFSFYSSYKYDAMRCQCDSAGWFLSLFGIFFLPTHVSCQEFLGIFSALRDREKMIRNIMSSIILIYWQYCVERWQQKLVYLSNARTTFNPTYCTLLYVVGVGVNIMQFPIYFSPSSISPSTLSFCIFIIIIINFLLNFDRMYVLHIFMVSQSAHTLRRAHLIHVPSKLFNKISQN